MKYVIKTMLYPNLTFTQWYSPNIGTHDFSFSTKAKAILLANWNVYNYDNGKEKNEDMLVNKPFFCFAAQRIFWEKIHQICQVSKNYFLLC
jgi:maltose-binding protein MalE